MLPLDSSFLMGEGCLWFFCPGGFPAEWSMRCGFGGVFSPVRVPLGCRSALEGWVFRGKFLVRQANKTPYGRACAADAFASRREPLLG